MPCRRLWPITILLVASLVGIPAFAGPVVSTPPSPPSDDCLIAVLIAVDVGLIVWDGYWTYKVFHDPTGPPPVSYNLSGTIPAAGVTTSADLPVQPDGSNAATSTTLNISGTTASQTLSLFVQRFSGAVAADITAHMEADAVIAADSSNVLLSLAFPSLSLAIKKNITPGSQEFGRAVFEQSIKLRTSSGTYDVYDAALTYHASETARGYTGTGAWTTPPFALNGSTAHGIDTLSLDYTGGPLLLTVPVAVTAGETVTLVTDYYVYGSSEVPEPATSCGIAAGLLLVGVLRYRRRG